MSFLDSQAEFCKTFGNLPAILPTRPSDSNIDSASSVLLKYAEKRHLNIFMHLCMIHYVGNDNIDPTLDVVETCRQINNIQQVRLINGRLRTDTPDWLFNQFNEISVGLPDNSTTWTLQLCLSYLAALSADLSEAITSEKSFQMPNLSILTTKALQINALRYIRTHAATKYRKLEKAKEKNDRIIT